MSVLAFDEILSINYSGVSTLVSYNNTGFEEMLGMPNAMLGRIEWSD